MLTLILEINYMCVVCIVGDFSSSCEITLLITSSKVNSGFEDQNAVIKVDEINWLPAFVSKFTWFRTFVH